MNCGDDVSLWYYCQIDVNVILKDFVVKCVERRNKWLVGVLF